MILNNPGLMWVSSRWVIAFHVGFGCSQYAIARMIPLNGKTILKPLSCLRHLSPLGFMVYHQEVAKELVLWSEKQAEMDRVLSLSPSSSSWGSGASFLGACQEAGRAAVDDGGRTIIGSLMMGISEKGVGGKSYGFVMATMELW